VRQAEGQSAGQQRDFLIGIFGGGLQLGQRHGTCLDDEALGGFKVVLRLENGGVFGQGDVQGIGQLQGAREPGRHVARVGASVGAGDKAGVSGWRIGLRGQVAGCDEGKTGKTGGR